MITLPTLEGRGRGADSDLSRGAEEVRAPGQGFEAALADPRFRHKNTPGLFGGPSFELGEESNERDEVALKAVRQYIEEYGVEPNQQSWSAAGMSPAERTIRRRFGSFKAAIEASG